ncbi:hypothetical protein [Pseudoalteromonas phage J2-1_QLiu-2017]|nr:hypothetical protein [Pseudoalteromonas phage J2-1_QLiu-2017]
MEDFIVSIVQREINKLEDGMFTALPATIVQYDPETQTATVSPPLYEHYADGVSIPLPEIDGVPVIFPASNNCALTFPIKEGDEVLLINIARDFQEYWETATNPSAGSTQRYNDYNDMVAMVGWRSKINSLKSITDGLRLYMDGVGGLEVKEDGKVSLYNERANIDLTSEGNVAMTTANTLSIRNGSEELIAILDEVLGALVSMKTNTYFGPQSPMNLATFQQLRTRLQTFKE